jgi:hypothetical protein
MRRPHGRPAPRPCGPGVLSPFVIFQKPRTIAEVTGPGDVGAAVASFDLGGPRPVLVLVGGAGLLDEAARERLAPIFAEIIAPAVLRHDAGAVDGGTDSGVMACSARPGPAVSAFR